MRRASCLHVAAATCARCRHTHVHLHSSAFRIPTPPPADALLEQMALGDGDHGDGLPALPGSADAVRTAQASALEELCGRAATRWHELLISAMMALPLVPWAAPVLSRRSPPPARAVAPAQLRVSAVELEAMYAGPLYGADSTRTVGRGSVIGRGTVVGWIAPGEATSGAPTSCRIWVSGAVPPSPRDIATRLYNHVLRPRGPVYPLRVAVHTPPAVDAACVDHPVVGTAFMTVDEYGDGEWGELPDVPPMPLTVSVAVFRRCRGCLCDPAIIAQTDHGAGAGGMEAEMRVRVCADATLAWIGAARAAAQRELLLIRRARTAAAKAMAAELGTEPQMPVGGQCDVPDARARVCRAPQSTTPAWSSSGGRGASGGAGGAVGGATTASQRR